MGMLWRTSPRRQLRGVAVGATTDVPPWEDLDGALCLIEAHSPVDWSRLCRLVRRILVVEVLDGQAEWRSHVRMILLRAEVLARPTTQPAHIAATIVHEVTHAWLEALGFQYIEARRGRIEAICFRREAAFAHRLPGGEALAAYYGERAKHALTSPHWTAAAFAERRRRTLEGSGLPRWLSRWLSPDNVPPAR